MKSYASKVQGEQLQARTAIIDGSAFSYFILNRALAESHGRLPSYEDVGAMAVNWLNSLGLANIDM